VYYVGSIIFAVMAAIVIVAFFKQRNQRNRRSIDD
jgi:uncharacterized membrane protein